MRQNQLFFFSIFKTYFESFEKKILSEKNKVITKKIISLSKKYNFLIFIYGCIKTSVNFLISSKTIPVPLTTENNGSSAI